MCGKATENKDFSFKKKCFIADILNVGYIVPLPNHYISDMPQGHCLAAMRGQAFFFDPAWNTIDFYRTFT